LKPKYGGNEKGRVGMPLASISSISYPARRGGNAIARQLRRTLRTPDRIGGKLANISNELGAKRLVSVNLSHHLEKLLAFSVGHHCATS